MIGYLISGILAIGGKMVSLISGSKKAEKEYKRDMIAFEKALENDDDREISAGEKFADADLIGIPQRVVVSSRGFEDNTFELKERDKEEALNLSKKELLKRIT